MTKEKQKNRKKDPFLRAYLSSLLGLILCVCMFCGTSYAWFTSDVTVQDNEIYVGMLDVDLLMDGQSLKNSSTKLYDNTVRWEPGFTVLRTLQVQNKGNLAFNYELTYTDPTTTLTTGATDDIAEHFVVYVINKQVLPEEVADFDTIAQSQDWTCVGTLKEVLAGKPVFTGTMAGSEQQPHTYTMALHMLESATGEGIMGHSLKLNVKLTAYQKSAEADAFGKTYDNLVKTPEEVKAAFAQGGKAILLADVDMGDEKLELAKGKQLRLDLNGFQLSKQSTGQRDSLIHVANGATLNIQDSSEAKNGKILLKFNENDTTAIGFAIHCEGIVNLYSGTVAVTRGGDITIAVDVRPNAHAIAFESPTAFNMYGGKVDGGSNHAIRLAVNSAEGYAQATATCTINGGQIVGRDGIFVQMLNAHYRPVELTVNGGTITGTQAIRVYAPTPESVIGTDEPPINITINGGTLTSQSDGSEAWPYGDDIKIQNTSDGGTVAQVLAKTTVTYTGN